MNIEIELNRKLKNCEDKCERAEKRLADTQRDRDLLRKVVKNMVGKLEYLGEDLMLLKKQAGT